MYICSMLSDKLNNIPKSPGCYLFKNGKDQIIYIGKSKFLPKRVKSYFNKNQKDFKTYMMVSEIKDVEFMCTDDEPQSLLLEDDLIKVYKPKYNMKGKDDRSRRWYVTVSNEEFPKIEVYNSTKLSGEVLLECTNSNTCYLIHGLIYDIFNLRTCSYELTEDNISSEKFKVCLDFHIGRCQGPCISGILKHRYNDMISDIRKIFNFDFSYVRSKLNRMMKYHSDKYEFELAHNFKVKLDKLSELESILEPFRVKHYSDLSRKFKEELGLINSPITIESFDNSHTSGDCQVSALVRYKNSKPDKSNYRKFNIKTVSGPDDYSSFDEVLNRRFKRLLDEKQELPSLVVIDGGKGQLNVAKSVFESLGLLGKIDLISISKDDRHQPKTIHTIDGKSIELVGTSFKHVLGEIQNEVHRFVITFHRNKKTKKLFS